MSWFEQNKFLGSLLLGLTLGTLLSGYFLLHERNAAGDQQARLAAEFDEMARLRRGNPFPNGENLRKMQGQTESYRSSLISLENELKARTRAIVPLQPNEFQAELRQAANSVVAKARESKVRLPENFFLGFDEYSTSLPNSTAAPLLGRELKAIEWLANTVIDAHIDSLNGLTRVPMLEEKAAPSPTPGKTRGAKAARPPGETARATTFNSLDLALSGTPAAARKALNRIANAKEHLFIVRTLLVKNQAGKGPPRAQAQETAAAISPSPAVVERAEGGNPAAGRAVSFIVGTEHIDLTAKIEIVNFGFPQNATR